MHLQVVQAPGIPSSLHRFTHLQVQPPQAWAEKRVFPCVTVPHKTVGQEMTDVPSNLSTHFVTRSVRTEVIKRYIAGTEFIFRNRQRRSKGEDLPRNLFQKSNSNQISSQLFSTFASSISLCVYSERSLKHKKKAVKASEQECRELCLSSFPTKSFEKPEQNSPQQTLCRCCA